VSGGADGVVDTEAKLWVSDFALGVGFRSGVFDASLSLTDCGTALAAFSHQAL